MVTPPKHYTNSTKMLHERGEQTGKKRFQRHSPMSPHRLRQVAAAIIMNIDDVSEKFCVLKN